jgi:hypothetical protein
MFAAYFDMMFMMFGEIFSSMFCVEMNREMKLLDYFFTRRAFGF